MASGITVEDMLSALQWTRCELQRLQSLVTLLDVSDGDKHSSAPLGEASRAQSHADVEQQSPDSRVKRVALASDGGDEPSAAESGYRASSSARDAEGVAAGSGLLVHASSATDMTRSERTRGDEDARGAHSQPGAVQGQHSLQEGGQGVPRRTLGVDNEDHVEVGESQERQGVCLHSTSNEQTCAQEQSDVREDELSSHATRAAADNLLDTRTKRMPLASPVSPQLASPAENQWLVCVHRARSSLSVHAVPTDATVRVPETVSLPPPSPAAGASKRFP
ncbi:hypothetical protein EON66_12425 [archaeon]|nr:MAG: hypothetical protein EON66_12425 [archaeon]